MNNSTKIIISSLIMAVIVSMLFLVISITYTFIASYIFALIAILVIAISLLVFDKKETTKAPQGHAFIYLTIIYSISNVLYSVIAYIADLSVLWTIVVHTAMLGIFIIGIIATTSGSEHINKVNSESKIKYENFQKEKQKYWN